MKYPKCACGKNAYTSWGTALHWALYCTRAGSPPLRIYKCPKVKGIYHLTKRVSIDLERR